MKKIGKLVIALSAALVINVFASPAPASDTSSTNPDSTKSQPTIDNRKDGTSLEFRLAADTRGEPGYNHSGNNQNPNSSPNNTQGNTKGSDADLAMEASKNPGSNYGSSPNNDQRTDSTMD